MKFTPFYAWAMLLVLGLQFASVNAKNGRGEPCELTVYERTHGAWTCYSDYGIMYDIWHGTMIVMFLGTTFFSVYMIKISGKTNPKNFTVNDNVQVLNCIATTNRVMWFIGVWNGRDWSVFLFGEFFNVISLRLTQILALAEILLLFLTWREVVNSSMKMRKADNSKIKPTVFALVFFLLVIVLPLELIDYIIKMPTLQYISMVVFLLSLLGLTVAGVFYQNKLGQLVAKSTAGKGGGSNAIKEVRTTVRIILFSSFLMILCISYLFSGDIEVWRRMIYWTMVHMAEWISFTAVSYSAGSSGLRKHREKQKRLALTVKSKNTRKSSMKSNFRSETGRSSIGGGHSMSGKMMESAKSSHMGSSERFAASEHESSGGGASEMVSERSERPKVDI